MIVYGSLVRGFECSERAKKPSRLGCRVIQSRDTLALSSATLVATIGSGLYATAGVIYFHRVVGLSVGAVGTGLTVAGIIGFLAAILIGKFSDRLGVRDVYAATLCLQALARFMFLFSHSYELFLAAAIIGAIGERGSAGAGGALVGVITEDNERAVKLRAVFRSVTNVGLTIGALLAGVAVGISSAFAFQVMMAGNVVALMLAAALVFLLPGKKRRGGLPQTSKRRVTPFRNRRFLWLTIFAGVMSLQFDLLSFALPIWVLLHTDAPRWSVGLILGVNTVLVVLLQVRASRGSEVRGGALRMFYRSGVTFFVSCCVIAVSGLRVVALPVLFLGVVVHTVGELWFSASTFSLSYEFGTLSAIGEYQTLFSLGRASMKALAPILLASTVLAYGAIAWLGVGVVLFLTGLLGRFMLSRHGDCDSATRDGDAVSYVQLT